MRKVRTSTHLLMFGIIILLIIIPLFFHIQNKKSDTSNLKSNNYNEVSISPVTLPSKIDGYENFGLDDLRALNDGNVDFVYFPDSKKIREINGVFSTQIVQDEQDALMALLSVRDLFEITNFDFSCSDISTDRDDVIVFTFNQLYKGIPVDGGLFRVIVYKDGTPKSVSGIFYSNINIETGSFITSEEGQRNLSIPPSDISKSELVIYINQNEIAYLSWKYSISSHKWSNQLDEKVIFVDAKNGDILEDRALIFE